VPASSVRYQVLMSRPICPSSSYLCTSSLAKQRQPGAHPRVSSQSLRSSLHIGACSCRPPSMVLLFYTAHPVVLLYRSSRSVHNGDDLLSGLAPQLPKLAYRQFANFSTAPPISCLECDGSPSANKIRTRYFECSGVALGLGVRPNT
jgi:hypothetical protein